MIPVAPSKTQAGRYLVILVALGILGCAPSEPWTSDNPEYALQAFLTALRNYDGDTVWEFLGPETRQFLEDRFERNRAALDELADQRPNRPVELLYRVFSPSSYDVERIELEERDDNHATVAVHSVFGAESSISMHRVQGRWTIELPLASPIDPQLE